VRVLISEPDAPLRALLARSLRSEGMEVTEAADGLTTLAEAGQQPPDLLLMNLQVRALAGSEILRVLRGGGAEFPILVWTALPELETRIGSLEDGADDCLVQPFSLRELRARSRALLRRSRRGSAGHPQRAEFGGAESGLPSGAAAAGTLCWGPLRLDRIRRMAEVGEAREAELTGRECRLLEELMAAGGGVLSRAELLQTIWGRVESKANLVDVYVGSLRRKLGEGEWIEAVRGRGYRMRAWLPTGATAALRGAE
jgi:DNA-binding response OmpR family regulator